MGFRNRFFVLLNFIVLVYSDVNIAASSITFQNKSYLSNSRSYFRSDEVPHYTQDFELRFYRPSSLNFSFDLGFQYVINEDYFYYHLQDFSYFRPMSNKWTLWMGLIKPTFSESDDFWRSGLWSRRQMLNKLTAEKEAQFGIFSKYNIHERRETNLTAYIQFSPLFLPELGPKIGSVNKKLRSENPWFHTPPNDLNIGAEYIPIEYSKIPPDIAAFVFNPFIIIGGEWKLNAFSGKTTYAYKPMNQVRLNAKLYSEENDRGEVPFKAELAGDVIYHQVLTNEFNRELGTDWKLKLSHSYEDPINTKLDESKQKRLIQNFKTMQSLDFGIQYKPSIKNTLEIHYREVYGGDSKDKGYWSSLITRQSIFEGRINFHKALRFQWQYKSLLFKFPFQSFFEFTYDRLQNGMTFLQDIALSLNPSLIVHLNIQTIGFLTNETKTENQATRFISDYRANDSLTMGVEYEF